MRRDVPLNLAYLSRSAELRSETYGFLSLVHLKMPDREFVDKLLSREVSGFLSVCSSHAGLPAEMKHGLEDIARFVEVSGSQDLDEVCRNLAVERTRLFRGIKPGNGPPPPYESVYRDREQCLMGMSAVAVAREYAGEGIGVPDAYKEPPDHIGLELDFMRFLTGKEAESWGRGERDKALAHLKKESHFLREHMAQWVGDFCGKVVDIAALDFYRGVARMTEGFISDDLGKADYYISVLERDKDSGVVLSS